MLLEECSEYRYEDAAIHSITHRQAIAPTRSEPGCASMSATMVQVVVGSQATSISVLKSWKKWSVNCVAATISFASPLLILRRRSTTVCGKIMPLLDTLSESHGVGPVCHELHIAPSTYYRHQNHRRHPEKRSK